MNAEAVQAARAALTKLIVPLAPMLKQRGYEIAEVLASIAAPRYLGQSKFDMNRSGDPSIFSVSLSFQVREANSGSWPRKSTFWVVVGGYGDKTQVKLGIEGSEAKLAATIDDKLDLQKNKEASYNYRSAQAKKAQNFFEANKATLEKFGVRYDSSVSANGDTDKFTVKISLTGTAEQFDLLSAFVSNIFGKQ